jgi:hypothetical protein
MRSLILLLAIGAIAGCEGPKGDKGDKGDSGAPGPADAVTFLSQPVQGPQTIATFDLEPQKIYWFAIQQTCARTTKTESRPVSSGFFGGSGPIVNARWEITQEGDLKLTTRSTGCYFVVWKPIEERRQR